MNNEDRLVILRVDYESARRIRDEHAERAADLLKQINRIERGIEWGGVDWLHDGKVLVRADLAPDAFDPEGKTSRGAKITSVDLDKLAAGLGSYVAVPIPGKPRAGYESTVWVGDTQFNGELAWALALGDECRFKGPSLPVGVYRDGVLVAVVAALRAEE